MSPSGCSLNAGKMTGHRAAFCGYTYAEHNLRIDHMFQWTRLRLSKLALAIRLLAGIALVLLASSVRAQDPFILSLAAAIDQSSLTPRERLGLRLFFDSNLSEPRGTACASCHDPRR